MHCRLVQTVHEADLDGGRYDAPEAAETTPGPLIMVVRFPCLLFIVLGARYVEGLRGNRTLAAPLAGITAAVAVKANLAVCVSLHTLLTSLRPVALAISLAAADMILRLPWSVLRTLGRCALLGLATVPLT